MITTLKKQLPQTPNKYAALIIWGFGLSNTWRLLAELGVQQVAAILYAFPFQLLLTYLQHLLWNPKTSLLMTADGKPERDNKGNKVYKKHYMSISWAALFVDILINIGGIWILLKDIPNSSSMLAIFDAFDLDATIISKRVIFILALLMSYLTATAPEQLYKMSENKSSNEALRL